MTSAASAVSATSALHNLVMCHRRARASGQTHALLAGAVAWAAGAPGGALLRILVGSRVHVQHVFARLTGLAPPATRYVHGRTEAVFPGGAAVRVVDLGTWELDGAGVAGPVLLDATAVDALAAREAERERKAALLLEARDAALREAREGVARAERERDEARAERDALRAIIEGRTAPATPCRWTPHGQRVLDCTGAEVELPPSAPFVPFGEALTAMRAAVPDLLTPLVVLPETPCARALDAAEGLDLEGLAAGRVQMAHGFARFPDGAWRQVCVWERRAPRDADGRGVDANG